MAGFEPARKNAPVSKTGMSTNFITSAKEAAEGFEPSPPSFEDLRSVP